MPNIFGGRHQQELRADAMKYRSFDKLMKEERMDTYIALEEMDYTWDLKEVHEFDELWTTGREEGKSPEYLIRDIAEYFGREEDEIAILALDRGRKGKI